MALQVTESVELEVASVADLPTGAVCSQHWQPEAAKEVAGCESLTRSQPRPRLQPVHKKLSSAGHWHIRVPTFKLLGRPLRSVGEAGAERASSSKFRDSMSCPLWHGPGPPRAVTPGPAPAVNARARENRIWPNLNLTQFGRGLINKSDHIS